MPPLRGPRRLGTNTAAILGGLLAGVLLGFAGIREWLGALGEPIVHAFDRVEDEGIVHVAIAAVVTLFLAIAVHEAGHAIAGALLGFRVHSIRIWRLQLEFPFRLSIYRGPSGGAGGWAICTPGTAESLGLRAGLMLAAGPGVNLLSGSIGLLLSPARVWPTAFVSWSIVLGVVNLLPIRTGPLFSDGYRILMLLFDRARGQRWLALMTLSKDLLDGVAPESFPQEFLRIATAVEDDSGDTVSAHGLAYSSAFRRGLFDDAARHLETCLRRSSRTSKALQQALMADAAAFAGRSRRDAALAQAWVDDLPAKTVVPWHRLWAEAGVLHARGDREGTLARLDAIESAIRSQATPLQKFSLGGVDRWRAELTDAAEAISKP
jgi:hypothetical protein